MEEARLAEILLGGLASMPPQLRIAARFVLEHPADVALMSMREQGRKARVSHTTMVRLAAWLGLDSYDDLRAIYARALRAPEHTLHGLGDSRRRVAGKENSAVSKIADALTAQTASLGEAATAKRLVAAADLLADANHLFCLGPRPTHSVVRHFAYLMSQLGKHVEALDTATGSWIDVTHDAGSSDAILAIGFAPYAGATCDLVRQASRRGTAIVAITDSKMSPLLTSAHEGIVLSTSSHSFFPSMTPALSVAEILAALIAEKTGTNIEEARKRAEQHSTAFDIYPRPLPSERPIGRATPSALNRAKFPIA
ncbi:MurR/RpiR family transcriptional regulator [Mesorhizobium sp.]|uniref:MurR/RpiR family transcriptional regulator n=1 Tax=Mesorhizobium sp. TaxID=1871066 RepID=UPI000FE59634|nr:MurR/RpiR family transcriptional regulator [Mesorhizobium sp.]RWK12269.1 MAG: MurR/RpiR family transcriptional regulator [Mesorhizobium sp.]